MNEHKIKNYQRESNLKFKNALTPKQFKNKRLENIADEVMSQLELPEDDKNLVLKLVRRNPERKVREASTWAMSQPGKDKLKLFVHRLRGLRTGAV